MSALCLPFRLSNIELNFLVNEVIREIDFIINSNGLRENNYHEFSFPERVLFLPFPPQKSWCHLYTDYQKFLFP